MADLSAFSSQNYNVTDWIDEILKEKNEEETLDAFLATVIMKLHVVSQEYTEQLEGGMMEAVALMPRTISEINRMQEVLGVLDREMSELSKQLYEFDQRNISGVEDLSRLDTLKLNMERCRDTLEEHARWNQLVREAKTMMESGGHYSDSADRLEILQNSLEILHYMPGHDERLQTCQQLTSSLLAVIQSKVLHDITLDRERSIGHDLIHSLKEMLYVSRKLKREDDFIQLYTQNRPNKLRHLIETCFLSTAYGSDVNSVILHTHKIPELYGQLNGFLFDESVTLLSLFSSEVVPDLLCFLIQNTVRLIHEIGMTKYLSIDYLTIDEFSKKSSNLIHGATDSTLFQTYSLLYEPFLKQPNLFIESESSQLQEELVRILSSIQFDFNSVLNSNSFSFLEEDDSNSKTKVVNKSTQDIQIDLSTIDADDISLLFNQYAQQVNLSIHELFQTIEATLSRGLFYLAGLRAKVLFKYLAPLCSQQIKILISKIDELRIASCMQVVADMSRDDNGVMTTSSSSSIGNNGLISAVNIAKQLSTHDLSSSSGRGRILLSCALNILATAGMICRLFSEMETHSTEQLEFIFTSLFHEPLTPKQAATLCSTQGAASSLTSPSSSSSIIGATIVSSYLRNELELESELKAFLSASTRRSSTTMTMITQSVFSSVMPWILKYKLTAEKYFFDLMISAPEDYLRGLHEDSIWTSSVRQVDQGDEEDHNRLPQQVLTQVGDHFFSLLQELEPFASKNKIQDLLQLKGDAEALALSSWKAIQGILDIKEEEACLSLGKRSTARVAISKAEQAMFGMTQTVDEKGDGGVGNEEDEIFRFVNEWLCAIADYSMGLFLVELLKVEKFSREGRDQLKVDLEYLSNVINALDLRLHPLCLHLLFLLQQDPKQLLTQIDFISSSTPTLVALQKFQKKMILSLFEEELTLK